MQSGRIQIPEEEEEVSYVDAPKAQRVGITKLISIETEMQGAYAVQPALS